MAQVFGLKYGLPRELQFIGSILEDSERTEILKIPRRERIDVTGMDKKHKQKRLGPIRFGRPIRRGMKKEKGVGKQKTLFNKPEKSNKLFFCIGVQSRAIEFEAVVKWRDLRCGMGNCS